MTTKKKEQLLLTDYVDAHEAAQLLSINHNMRIPAKKVCLLCRSKKHHIRVIRMHNANLYNRQDIMQVRLKVPQHHP